MFIIFFLLLSYYFNNLHFIYVFEFANRIQILDIIIKNRLFLISEIFKIFYCILCLLILKKGDHTLDIPRFWYFLYQEIIALSFLLEHLYQILNNVILRRAKINSNNTLNKLKIASNTIVYSTNISLAPWFFFYYCMYSYLINFPKR